MSTCLTRQLVSFVTSVAETVIQCNTISIRRVSMMVGDCEKTIIVVCRRQICGGKLGFMHLPD